MKLRLVNHFVGNIMYKHFSILFEYLFVCIHIQAVYLEWFCTKNSRHIDTSISLYIELYKYIRALLAKRFCFDYSEKKCQNTGNGWIHLK